MKTIKLPLNVLFNNTSFIKFITVDIRLVFILFSVIGWVNTYGQNLKKVDSILTIVKKQTDTTQIISYAQLWAEYIFVNPLESKPYLDSTLVLAERLENPKFIARTKNYLGVFYNMTSQYKKADSVYDIVINKYTKLGDNTQVSYALNNKANSLRSLGRFEECLETHMRALKLKEKINDTEESIAASYWNIGNIHGDIKNYDISNQYYRKAKVIYNRLGLRDDLSSVNLNLGINLKEQKQYEEAKKLFKEVIPYYKSQSYNNDLAGAYDNLGIALSEQDSLDLALDYFKKSLEISKKYGETSLIGLNLRHLGEVYNKKGEYKKALSYLKDALQNSKETETRKKRIGDLLELSKAHAGLGNYKQAYKHHTEYHQLHEEILGQENIDRMNEMEVKYQSEKKERDLLIKEKEIKLLEERKQKAENQRLFFIITALGILAFALAVIYGLRQKMKRNRIEREKLDIDLEFKGKQLTTHALHLAHKNEVLLDLKQQIKNLKIDSSTNRGFQNIINNINLDINNDSNWEQFKTYFEDVHKNFNSRIINNYPEVSNNDLRLMSLLKMNLSSKEIANILNISIDGVKKARYRLRKKLKLSTEESLQELVISM